MVDAPGPTFRRRQLGGRMEELRKAAGMSREAVAMSRIASESTVKRLEAGTHSVQPGTVMALAARYGASPEEQQALLELAVASNERGWWEEFGKSVPDWVGLYVGLEQSARSIRAYQPHLVHGVLQTEAYARAIIGADQRLSPETVAERVRFRRERQRTLLARSPRPNVTVIMDAAALARRVESDEIMAEQMDALRSVHARGLVKVLVAPWDALYPMRGMYTLLNPADAADPQVAYAEFALGARYMEKPEQLAEYEHLWAVTEQLSVTIEEYRS